MDTDVESMKSFSYFVFLLSYLLGVGKKKKKEGEGGGEIKPLEVPEACYLKSCKILRLHHN
jgi:hypothetical protein